MHALPHILASASGAEVVIFLIVVAIGWISSAVDKWKKNSQPTAPPPPSAVPPILPPAQQRLLQQQKQAALKRQLRDQQLLRQQQIAQAKADLARSGAKLATTAAASKPTAKRVAATAAAAVRPAVAAAANSKPATEIVATTAPAISTARAQPSKPISAAAMHDWLQPATLRKQFLLTEIFNPPIALREQHL